MISLFQMDGIGIFRDEFVIAVSVDFTEQVIPVAHLPERVQRSSRRGIWGDFRLPINRDMDRVMLLVHDFSFRVYFLDRRNRTTVSCNRK
jgi:hypothetical protein